ncbi:MAG: damage-control phosphatase ARMT1 family protein [Promethearchaeota archaeon]
MDLQPQCLSCLIGQVEKAYRLLRPSISNAEIVEIQKKIMVKLADMNQKKMPYYGQAVYQSISKFMGENDPYQKIKHNNIKKALIYVPSLREMINKSSDPLLIAIIIAIIGNTFDFGTPHKINIEDDIRNFSLDNLGINNYDEFVKDLRKSKKILIIGDNAGEMVFDRIMLEYLTGNFPEKEFIYSVRSGPAINDITKNDMEKAGLSMNCKIIEGSASPGVIFEQTSEEFQKIFKKADLILSKGQGNYESLDDIEIGKSSLYFLLKAKCDFVAKRFGVKVGSLIFKKRIK